tara:strand:- start:1087 stop:1341 length:255 start_codon:yes stop_codon:yes gene_type:complete
MDMNEDDIRKLKEYNPPANCTSITYYNEFVRGLSGLKHVDKHIFSQLGYAHGRDARNNIYVKKICFVYKGEYNCLKLKGDGIWR